MPTGRILHEARVKLDKYTLPGLRYRRAVGDGFYEGPKLLVTASGRLQAGAERRDGSWSWLAPEKGEILRGELNVPSEPPLRVQGSPEWASTPFPVEGRPIRVANVRHPRWSVVAGNAIVDVTNSGSDRIRGGRP